MPTGSTAMASLSRSRSPISSPPPRAPGDSSRCLPRCHAERHGVDRNGPAQKATHRRPARLSSPGRRRCASHHGLPQRPGEVVGGRIHGRIGASSSARSRFSAVPPSLSLVRRRRLRPTEPPGFPPPSRSVHHTDSPGKPIAPTCAADATQSVLVPATASAALSETPGGTSNVANGFTKANSAYPPLPVAVNPQRADRLASPSTSLQAPSGNS